MHDPRIAPVPGRPVAARRAGRHLPRAASVALTVVALAAPSAARAADGDPDPSFGAGGIVSVPFDLGSARQDIGTAVVRTSDDRLLIAGSVATGAMVNPRAIAVAKVQHGGSLDFAFGGGDARVDYSFGSSVGDFVAAAVTREGEIVLAGTVQWSLTDSDFLVLRLLPDGALDPRFGGGSGYVVVPFDVNPGGQNFDVASSLYLTPSEKIVVAGTVKRGGDDWDMAVTRLTPSGALDTTFALGTGKLVVPIDAGGYAGQDQVLEVLPSATGGILLVGGCENGAASNTDFAVVHLDQGGNLDATFGTGGKVVFPFDLVPGGKDYGNAGAVDRRGRIFVAGWAFAAGGNREGAIACLTAAGAPCPDFGTEGRVHLALSPNPQAYEQLTGVAVDDLGRILAAGVAVPNHPYNRDVAVLRMLPGGALDPTFAGGTGIRRIDLDLGPGNDDDEALDLVLVDGQPVVAGAAEYQGVDDDFFLLRLWVSLIRAEDFERGTLEGWSDTAP